MGFIKIKLGFCLALLVAGLCGCDSAPKLVQVKGVVKVDGTAKEGVQLTFYPNNGSLPSSAVSSANGEFAVTTDLNPGIPEGQYTVSAVYPDPAHKVSEKDRMQGLGEPGPDLFRGRFATKEKGIAVEVTASTVDLPIDLQLKK